jgi:hypothetical protein
MGISEYDFNIPRSREEIKVLFERIGFTYKVGKFNAMYNRAIEMTRAGESVSVRAFMQVVNEMHHID